MNNFKIKVCGIKRVKDAQLAVKHKADMLGFIFYNKSPRYISISNVKEIIDFIPPTIDRVGVFVNHPVEKILSTAQMLSLDFIQLGGDEKNKDIKYLQRHGFKVIKSFRIKSKNDYDNVYKSNADIIQLDNSDSGKYGGSGRQFNWKILPPRKINNLMLSGGLDINNITEGIKRFKPLIVDVNSGVEISPGIKSPTKLKAFMQFCNRVRYER